MITFTEDERRFMFSQVNDIYQNWNYRSLEEHLLKSILVKLGSTSVDLTEQESRRLQYLFEDLKTLYSRLADVRAQHIIQGDAGKMSMLGSNQQIGQSAGGRTGDSGYFNGPATYNLCQTILKKLLGS